MVCYFSDTIHKHFTHKHFTLDLATKKVQYTVLSLISPSIITSSGHVSPFQVGQCPVGWHSMTDRTCTKQWGWYIVGILDFL